MSNDKNKTWKIINDLRGKDKSGIKPLFVIGNERIICRIIIANKLNDYFAMLASNLNAEANKEVPITAFPSFNLYLLRSSETSIFLEDCYQSEVEEITNELKIGKSSDIPIALIKATCNIIAPFLAKLYNISLNSRFFPKIFKISKITPICRRALRVIYIYIYDSSIYYTIYVTVEGIQVLVYSLVYIHCIFMILIDTIHRSFMYYQYYGFSLISL